MRQHEEKHGNLPEDHQLTKACNDAGSMINVSQRQFFVSIPDVQLEGNGSTGSCRESSYPRSDDRCQPKGLIRGNTKIGPVLEVMVAKLFDRYGLENKIGSMQEDGTQSWMVISRGVDKYVTELAVDHTKPISL